MMNGSKLFNSWDPTVLSFLHSTNTLGFKLHTHLVVHPFTLTVCLLTWCGGAFL